MSKPVKLPNPTTTALGEEFFKEREYSICLVVTVRFYA
jgi:hypothetical protein